MRKAGIVLACLAGAGVAAMLYRELPAVRRYVKITRM